MPNPCPNTDMDSTSTTMASSSIWWEDRDRDFSFSEQASTTFSGLRQVDQLEKTVLSLQPIQSSPVVEVLKNGKGSNTTSSSEGGRVLGDSVAIVINSDVPLSYFRQSMVQMIVENGNVEVEGIKELVGRYLLHSNSPEHHPATLRAFAEQWNQVFPRFQMNTQQDLLVNVK